MMSIVFNQPEAQLKKITFHHLEGQPTDFAHVTEHTTHMICNLVIYDPETEKILLARNFGETISSADEKITSFGSTKKIVNKREFDLGNKDMFLFYSEWADVLPKEFNALDVFIPVTYFSDIEVTTVTEEIHDGENKKLEAETDVHLYIKDKNGKTFKLGVMYVDSKEFTLF